MGRNKYIYALADYPLVISSSLGYLPKSIYDAVLPLILANLKTPKTDKSLAQDLDVQVGQIRAWLKTAVAEKKVIKHKKPVTYQINPDHI